VHPLDGAPPISKFDSRCSEIFVAYLYRLVVLHSCAPRLRTIMTAVNYEKPSIAAEDHPYQVVVSAARPGSPSDGDAIYETDTDKAYVWNGSSWVLTADASFLPDAASDDQTAAEVVFSPAGTIAANTVQAAIEEISADTTNLTASAVASVASGNLAATNVQTALNELQTELDTHDADHFTVCTAGGRPGSPGDGDMIYETDTDRVLVYNGTGWVIFGDGTLLSLNGSDVGIGTAPVAGNKLHVVDDVNGSLTGIRIDNADQTLKLQTYFESGVAQYAAIESTNDGGSGGLNLALNAANGGNVGIGTTSPASDLHIGGSSVVTFTNSANTAGKRGMRIGFDNDRLTIQRASDAGAWEANYLVVDQDNGRVGIGNTAPAYPLSVTGTSQANGFSVNSSIASVYHAGSLGFTDSNHGMLFRPPRAGAAVAYAFQDYAGANGLWEVTEAGVSNFRGSGTSAAYNDGGTWGTISDARLKTITERITDSNYLAKLNKFGLVKYVLDKEFTRVEAIGEELDNQETTWEITDKETPSYEMLGVIAQEVREFAPGLVDESAVNGQLQVKTSVLTWMLVGAVQELSTENDGLKSQISGMAAAIQELAARVEELEV
jgi:hypothetical protein